MPRRKIPVPPLVDGLIALLGKSAEKVVDSLAEIAYRVIQTIPALRNLSENEKRALAYALVGDLIASPIPEPLDAPIDAVVQDRISKLLPNMNRYLRIGTKIVELLPLSLIHI